MVLMVPATASARTTPASLSRQRAGSPAQVALVWTPAVTMAAAATSTSRSRSHRHVVHVGGRAHHRGARRGGVDLGADALVIALGSFSSIGGRVLVAGAFAALMIDEMAHAGGLAAVARRGRDDAVRRVELDDARSGPPAGPVRCRASPALPNPCPVPSCACRGVILVGDPLAAASDGLAARRNTDTPPGDSSFLDHRLTKNVTRCRAGGPAPAPDACTAPHSPSRTCSPAPGAVGGRSASPATWQRACDDPGPATNCERQQPGAGEQTRVLRPLPDHRRR